MTKRGSLDTRGARLDYLVEGQGSPVLVVGSAIYYPRTFSPELRKQCRMYFVDLRHFAETTPSARAEITLETYFRDINVLCKFLELDHFTLVGHSHHGNLALEYAHRHPHRVNGLALIGTPPCDVPRTLEASEQYWEQHASAARKAAHARRQEAVQRRLANLPPDKAFVTAYNADAPCYWYDPEYNAAPLWRGVPINNDALLAFRRFFEDYEFSLGRPEFATPIFVAAGSHDFVVPPTLWSEADRAEVSWHLFERSGHTPQLEEPEAFNAAFLEWLAA